jgi:hypothetical protein
MSSTPSWPKLSIQEAEDIMAVKRTGSLTFISPENGAITDIRFMNGKLTWLVGKSANMIRPTPPPN